MAGFVVRGFCGAAFGAFFAMGLMFFELLRLPVILYWIVIALSALAGFLLAGFYGDRAFNWLKDLWEWFGP